MQVIFQCKDGKIFSLDVQTTDTIGAIKSKIKQTNNIPENIQCLIFNNTILEDGKTVQFYGIQNGSTIQFDISFICGNCPAHELSITVGKIKNDTDKVKEPLKPGKLSRRYIRNTNSSRVYDQEPNTCYAFAACSAYINTIMRIYGAKEPPSFPECFAIANYNGNNGGQPKTSIEHLENHFHFGIIAKREEKSTIYDALKISVIVSFTTSQQGWNDVKHGHLLTKPAGEANGWHASVVEGYDFDQKCLICKNSWGDKTAEPRFNLKVTATHSHYFTHVYFTLNSIARLVQKTYVPRISKCTSLWNNFLIDSAWMDETTAIYESDYISEVQENKQGPLNYLGYDLQQWIYAQLNPYVFPLNQMGKEVSELLSSNDEFNLKS